MARLDFLRTAHRPAVLAHAQATLGLEDRASLRNLTRDRWYPLALMLRLDHAVAGLLGSGIYEDLGRAVVHRRLAWLGQHAPFVTVHTFLSRGAEEHRRFFDFGCARYSRTGFHSCDMIYSEYPPLDPAFCLSARGYLRGALELLTGRPGAVTEASCQSSGAPACVFQLDWRGFVNDNT